MEQQTTEQTVTETTPDKAHTPVNRWPWIAISVVAVCLLVFFMTNGSADSKAVAKVNGKPITQQELFDEMVKQGGEQTLESLITKKLIDQELASKKVNVSDKELDEEIAEIKKQFPSEEQFAMALAQNNFTMDTLKKEIRQQISVTKLIEPLITHTEDDLKKFFEQYKDYFSKPERVKASHILVKTKEEADAVLKEVKGGSDFAAVAKSKSQDPGSKDDGGNLDFFEKGMMDPAFEAAAFKLAKGEISDVVESSFGFHIIKVTDKEAGVNPSYEEKKVEVKKQFIQMKASEKRPEWLEKLKSDAKIENFLNNKLDRA